MKLFPFLVIALLMLGTVPFVDAWGPATHVYLLEEVLKENTGLLKDLIVSEKDACLDGLMSPDKAVIYYYVNFAAYEGLHDWNTATKLWQAADTDRQRAFSVCYKLHLAADGVSHNYYVPGKIRSSKLPNEIIHAISELKIEERYLVGEVGIITPHAMDADDEFLPWFNEVTGTNWDTESVILRKAIGGGTFYDEGFAIPKAGLWWNIYRYLAKGVGVFVTDKSDVPIIRMAKDKMLEVLEGGTPVIDPAGGAELKKANAEINFWLWGGGIVLLIGLYWLLFKSKLLNKKKTRR